ncbi:MAG: methyl-accepting chemotaxis protein [Halothiobacillaceae bacterium]
MKSMSLGYRISLWLLALGLLGLILASAYGYSLRGDLKQSALDRRAGELTATLANRLETKFDVGITNAVTLASDPDLIAAVQAGNRPEVERIVTGVRKAYKDYTNYQGIHVHVFDAEGRAVFDSAPRPESGETRRGGVGAALRQNRASAAFERDANGNVLIRAFAPVTQGDRVVGAIEMTQGVGSISRNFAEESVHLIMLLDRAYLNADNPAWNNQAVGDYVVANDRWFTDEVVAFARAVDLAATLETGGYLDQDWFTTVRPIQDDQDRMLGMILLGVPAEVLHEDIAKSTSLADSLLLAMVILVVLLVGLVIFLVQRLVACPLGNIAKAMEDIAHGEGDLTHRLEVRRQDEIGRVAGAFNRFADNIQALVQRIADQSQQVAGAGSQLEHSTEQTRTGADQQQQEIVQVAAAINEMGAAAGEVAQNAQQTMSATEQGAQEVESAREAMDRLLKTIEIQTEEIERAADDITALEKQSESIGDVVQVIREITEQTNLLALNAAIESARAGEHGRGFAVVANEVRTLAGRTHESTKSIEETVAALQERTRAAVKVMQENRDHAVESLNFVRETHEMLRHLADMMHRIRDMTTQIAAATEEETAATEELGRSIHRIQQVAEEAAHSAEASARSAEHLLGVSGEMQSSVSRFHY